MQIKLIYTLPLIDRFKNIIIKDKSWTIPKMKPNKKPNQKDQKIL